MYDNGEVYHFEQFTGSVGHDMDIITKYQQHGCHSTSKLGRGCKEGLRGIRRGNVWGLNMNSNFHSNCKLNTIVFESES